jgi:hypothetical protein
MRTRIGLALLLAAGVGVLLFALSRGPDAEAIADHLPVYPGARLMDRSAQRYDDWSRDVYLTYDLPPATTRSKVDRFYRERMESSWKRPDRSCEGFTRDGALVMAGVDIFDRTVLNVVVASHGAGSCDEFASVLHS